ncbi:MAG TPA: tRNA epoxyqueuosine(34) reductase QueG [Terriglobales bacterium]|nr:tRNA epoxyqueuosine(34) reductase QueG [Terriglobales bacterium]
MKSIGEITTLVKEAAREAGFELAGIAPVRDFAELEHLPKWVAAGHAGEMKYMEARDESGRLKRASLRTVAPWARSVIVCAINYNTAHPYSTEVQNSGRGWISRYAWSREDYHRAVMRRLRVVEGKLRAAIETSGAKAPDLSGPSGTAKAVPFHGDPNPAWKRGPSGPRPAAEEDRASAPVDLITRCYVDTGPVVERVYAKYAGIGWIGKNTCILNQKMGSWLFLGVILTSIELAPDLPAPDRCGTCTRCIEACPTDALIVPYQLDSNRCISYLTIEKRGSIPESLREGMGRHVFGCDICQDVCPWNRKAPATTAPELQPREGLVNPALEWLAEMTAEEFREKFRGSPLRRAKRSGLRRNATVAMGNSGDRRFAPLLERLAADDDSLVAEHARWAMENLDRPRKKLV